MSRYALPLTAAVLIACMGVALVRAGKQVEPVEDDEIYPLTRS